MKTLAQTVVGIGLVLALSGTASAQWYRYDSNRKLYMEQRRATPRTPGGALTQQEYLDLEHARQDRLLQNRLRRDELVGEQRIWDDATLLQQQNRTSWQLHDRQLQSDAQAYETQRETSKQQHEERLELLRQDHQERMEQLRQRRALPPEGSQPAGSPPVDYRGHGG